MTTKVFVTSTGEKVKGQKLAKALSKVADFFEANAKAIRAKDEYADHVTEETKEAELERKLALAARIRSGIEPIGFWLWQRINTELTGECVPFFKPEASK